MKKLLFALLFVLSEIVHAQSVMMPGPGLSRVSSTASLLVLNESGSNGSTTFIDQSPNAFTVSQVGSGAAWSTAQKVANATSSGLFDATNGGLTVADNAALRLQTIWTVEFWIRSADVTTTTQIIYRKRTPGDPGPITLVLNPSAGGVVYSLSSDGINNDIANTVLMHDGGGSQPLVADTWYYFALVSDGTTIKPYNNITSATTAANYSSGNTTSSTSLDQGTQPVYIGSNQSGAGGTFNGYIQSLRVTKGYALYSSDFTVPTPPLQ